MGGMTRCEPPLRCDRLPQSSTTRRYARLIEMARPWLVAAFLLCVASAHTARALDADAAVIDLDDSNWKDLVIENGREAWVVSFGADGCAPCAQMAPTFAKAAKHMGGIVNFGHVHVGDASIKLAQSLGLTKVPHVVGLPAHKTLNPYTKKSEKIAVEYRNSTASHKRIAEFAATLLPDDRVTRIADADALARARTDASHLPVAVLVTAKETTGSLFKSLALRFRGRVAFAEVHVSDAPDVLASIPGLADPATIEPPALLLFPPAGTEGGDVERHGGEMNARSLAAYIESKAADAAPEDDAPEVFDPRGGKVGAGGNNGAGPGGESPGGESPGDDDGSLFPSVTPGRFEELVLKAPPVAVVAFTKLGDRACVDVSRRLASSAIKGVNGRVSLMEVNASSPEGAKLAERYAPETFFSANDQSESGEGTEDDKKCVAAVLFPHGTDKEDADPDTYDGDVDDAEAFAAWVREAIPDFTMPLPQPRLVEAFMQNDPFAPKVILFADAKPDSALGRDFIALAANFHQDFQFATIPSGDKVNAAKFGVQSYPSLRMMFVPPLKGGENPDTNTVQMQVAQFPGHTLDYLYMHSWLDQIRAQVLGKDPTGGDGGPEKGAADPVKLVGTPKELDAECGGAGLCVVAFVPQGTEDTELRTAIVQAAADDKSDRPVKFVVVDPVKQRSFAAAFEVSADDVPAVAVVSMRKNRFATYRATFSAERIAGFLDDVLSAKQRTRMIQEIPKLVPGGEEPEEVFDEDVEEEFDLADIMGEDVEGEVTNEERLSRIERELAEEEAEKKRKKAEEEDAAAAAKKASKKKKKKKRKGKAHSEL